MASKVKYTPVEAGSLALGSAGSKVLVAATAEQTGSFCAVTALADTTFTTLTPEDSAHPSQANYNFTIPAGVTIYGRWTAIELNSGAVVVYNG